MWSVCLNLKYCEKGNEGENSCILFQLGMDRRMNLEDGPIDPGYRIHLNQVMTSLPSFVFSGWGFAYSTFCWPIQPHLRYFLHRHDVLKLAIRLFLTWFRVSLMKIWKTFRWQTWNGQKGLPLFTHTICYRGAMSAQALCRIEFSSEILAWFATMRWANHSRDIYDDRGFIFK